MSYLEMLKNKQSQSPSKMEKAIALVDSLTFKNIMATYSDERTIVLLHPHLLSDLEKREIAELSAEITNYLRGDSCFISGGTCTVEDGNFVIQEVSQTYRRFLVNKPNGTQS